MCRALFETRMNPIIRLKYSDYFFILIILCLSACLQTHVFFNWDASWHIEGAKRMLNGGTYSKNIFDDNLPMVFWFYMPAVVLSGPLNISVITLSLISIYVTVSISFILSNYFLQKIYYDAPRWKVQIMRYGILILLLFFPGEEFGQRDMLVSAFILPYVFLLISRIEKNAVKHNTNFLLVIVGFCTAMSVSLNPFYFLIIVATEILCFFYCRNFFRTELITFYIAIALYFFIIYLFFPDYYSVIIPSYLVFSHHYNSDLLNLFETYATTLIFFAAFVLFLLSRCHTHISKFSLAVFICAIIAYLVYLINGKAWLSHIILVVLFSDLFFLAALSDVISCYKKNILVSTVTIALSLYCLCLSALQFLDTESAYVRLYQNPKSNLNQLISFFNQQPQHSSLYVFSPNLITTFAFIHYTTLRYLPPWPNCWMLSNHTHLIGLYPSIQDVMNASTQRKNGVIARWKYQWTTKYQALFFQQVIFDFTSKKPDFVMIDTTANINYLVLLMQHTQFETVWSHYHFVRHISHFDIYQFH